MVFTNRDNRPSQNEITILTGKQIDKKEQSKIDIDTKYFSKDNITNRSASV
mgnify:CR=1 FL=1